MVKNLGSNGRTGRKIQGHWQPLLFGALTAVALTAPAVGYAQSADSDEADNTLEPGETILDRPRPEVEPQGARAGGFLIFPSLTLEEEYNDNIFATPNNEEEDFITHVQPNLSVESQWANHALNFQAGSDAAFYADNNDENYVDYNVGFDGRYDISRNDFLFAGASFQDLHEDRGSPDAISASEEPTEYDLFSGFTGGEAKFNRVTTRLELTADRYDYDDVGLVGGGTVDNDDRDRNIYETRARIGYEIQPRFSAFVEGAYNVRSYDDENNNGFDRDSDGYEAVVGTEFDLTGITFGEVFVGYRSQSYDDSQLDDVSGPTVGLELTSNVTPLTTIQGRVQRTIEETTSAGASGYFATTGQVTVDHELLRNLLLNAGVSYTQNDYEGISREDTIFGAQLGGRYLVNRYLEAGLEYNFTDRNSDVAGVDYTQNKVMLNVTLQY